MEALPSFTIQEALKDRNILITGTTGFLGKVVLEKLVREIDSINGIYLLIRGSGNYQHALDRFRHEIFNSSIFERLKMEDEHALLQFVSTKVHCITGEITETQFGLNNEEYELLAADIDLIINSAASVNFREELDQAIKINAFAVENVARFAIDAGNIPLIHVSTCYVNGYNSGHVHEKNNGPAGLRFIAKKNGYYKVRPIIEKLVTKTERIKAKYPDAEKRSVKLVELGIKESQRLGWNDTYTLTKWMAEQLLIEMLQGGTLTILRPSIIESTLEDPVPGWIEGIKVADAIIFAYARGKVSLFPGKSNSVLDVIPADYVANAILISAAEALAKKGKHRTYQCCSGSSNPLKLKHFRRWVMAEGKNNHEQYDRLFYKKPSKPFIFVNRRLFRSVAQTVRTPISLIPDEMASKVLSERQHKLMKNLKTTLNLSDIFSFYTSPNYIFHNDELMNLSNQLCKADRRRFPVNAQRIHWKTYVRKIHLTGLQRYALHKPKHNEQTIAVAQEVQQVA